MGVMQLLSITGSPDMKHFPYVNLMPILAPIAIQNKTNDQINQTYV